MISCGKNSLAKLFILSLACKCNSKGTQATRNVLHFIYQGDSNSCNTGSCTCRIGYKGTDCNTCEVGYYVSSFQNGENVCTSKKLHIKYLLEQPSI